jgi:hypothetical protein
VAELYLLLGCFGTINDGFVSCASCENKILRVQERLDKYKEMMDYFDNCHLFDRPIFEYSAINHFIKNMQDRYDQVAVGKRLWSEKNYTLYQKFIAEHRLCGIYIKLSLLEDGVSEKTPFIEKSLKISAKKEESEDIKPTIPKLNLKLIRSRF